jgi:hypothetical protein
MNIAIKEKVLFTVTEIYLIIKTLDDNLPIGYAEPVQKLNKLLHENKAN